MLATSRNIPDCKCAAVSQVGCRLAVASIARTRLPADGRRPPEHVGEKPVDAREGRLTLRHDQILPERYLVKRLFKYFACFPEMVPPKTPS